MEGRDNTVIEALLKIAKACGTFPFCSLTYQIIIITLTLFYGIYSIYTNAVTYYPGKEPIMIFMDFLVSSFTVLLGVSIQVLSLCRLDVWKQLYQNLKVDCIKNSSTRKSNVFLELLAVHLIYFVRLFLVVLAWLPLVGIAALNYFFRHLNEYYSMIYVLLLIHINIVIKRKFSLMNMFLRRSTCVRYVQRNYQKTMKLIDDFNIAFGHQILLIMVHAGIALLECLNNCLRFTDFSKFQNVYILS